jgi:hypothetical protein
MRIRLAALGLFAAGFGLALPAFGVARTSVDTLRGHLAQDSVVVSARQAAQWSRQGIGRGQAVKAAADTSADPGAVGQWGPLVNWPVVAVFAALLPDGKVLAYDSLGDKTTESYAVDDHTRATIWDPATGSQTDVTLSDGFNIFCSGLAHLFDGDVFVAGGNKDPQLDGIVQTHEFSWGPETWSRGTDMAYARWYPTVTAMGNGEMLITSGGPAIAEVRQLDGSIRQLTDAPLTLPLYPWLDVAPDGRAFDSGPDQTLRSLNPTGTGAWQIYGSRDALDRTYGGHAMYGIGKILVAGGGPSTKTAEVIDINGATPTVTPTGSMAYGRRQNNLTVLADGTVLTTGGNSSGAELVDLNAGVYAAEIWDPATGQWKTMSSMQVTRQYHSTALLLPDGRVLSAGGGLCVVCDQVGYLNKNAEIFSPPYLFAKDGSGALAPRPTVTSVPAAVTEGTTFSVSTPDASSITKVALVKLGAVTHSNNMEQRYVPLSFTSGSGTLTIAGPASANIAPPGQYMLFIVNSAGVPSVAPIITVVPSQQPAPIWYQVVSRRTGKCVDASGWGTGNGTWVQQWTCGNGQSNQEWELAPAGGGFNAVLNRNALPNNQVLDVTGGPGATGDGTKIQTWAYVGGTNQQWQPVPLGDGYYELQARNSGKCLDVTDGSTADGARLQQWSCYGGPNQAFQLVPEP